MEHVTPQKGLINSSNKVWKGTFPGIGDLTKTQCGIRENVNGIRDFTKTLCGIRETLTGFGN